MVGAYYFVLTFLPTVLFSRILQPLQVIPESALINETFTTGSQVPNKDQNGFKFCTDKFAYQIAFSGGNDSLQRSIMDNIKFRVPANETDSFYMQAYDSIDAINEYQSSKENLKKGKMLCFAVEIKDFEDPNFIVNLHMAPQFLQGMSRNQTVYQAGSLDLVTYQSYELNGFLEVLSALQAEITDNLSPGSTKYEFEMNYMGTFQNSVTQDPALDMIRSLGALVFTMIPICTLIGLKFVSEGQEQETEIYNLSKTMGVKMSSYIVVFYILLTLNLLTFGSAILILFKVFIFKASSMIILVISLYISSYGLVTSLIFYLFGTGTIGKIIFGLIQFSQILISVFFSGTPPSGWLNVIIILLSPVQGLNDIFRIHTIFESKHPKTGLGFNNWMEDSFGNSVFVDLMASIVALIFYSLATLYIWPMIESKTGEKLPHCYCLRKRVRDQGYQLLEGNKAIEECLDQATKGILLKDESDLMAEGDYELPNLEQFIEMDDEYLKDSLRINKLVKTFKVQATGETNYAVNELSLSMHKNQIFVLLGHNGAGKTTTISMLTGLLPKTQGHMQVFGFEVTDQRDLVNKITGICPQKDVLLLNMTVEENLRYFCRLKLMTEEAIDAYIDKMLTKVSLESKKNAIAKTLSGGQKRKLQLLIAIAGDTKFLLLDEPSSGMDPTARRDTWDLIKELKKDRIIILTTHYMDEADVLGDRIGIMSKGQLKTCGSSLFLKKKYGLGTIIEISQNNVGIDMTDLHHCLQDMAKRFTGEEMEFEGHLDESNLYVIKLPTILRPHFEEIFRMLDSADNQIKFNIKQYNVRVTSLEEVFNKIGEDEFRKELEAEPATEGNEIVERVDIEKTQLSSFQKFWVLLTLRFQQVRFSFTMIAIYMGAFSAFFLILFSSQLKQIETEFQLTDVSSLFNATSFPQGFRVAFGKDRSPGPQVSVQDLINSEPFSQEGVEVSLITSYEDVSSNFTQTLFDFSKATQGSGIRGGIIMESQQYDDLKMYVLTNKSSPIGFPVMSSIATESALQVALQKPDLRFKVNMQLLEPNVLFQQSENIPIFFGLAGIIPSSLAYSAVLITIVYKRDLRNGYQKQKSLCGMTFNQRYFSDLALAMLFQSMGAAAFLGTASLSKQDLTGFWVLVALNVINRSVYEQALIQVIKNLSPGAGGVLQGFNEVIFGLAIPVVVLYTGAQFWNGELSSKLEMVFSFFPNCAIGLGLAKILYRYRFYSVNGGDMDPFGKNGCYYQVVGMCTSTVLLPVLTLIIANCGSIKESMINEQPEIVDSDVLAEAERVKREKGSDMVSVDGLIKQYRVDPRATGESADPFGNEERNNQDGILRAVRGISFGIQPKESFILLGVNGAGKSTTFKCLTTEERPTSGHVIIDGVKVQDFEKSPSMIGNKIGYCPQTNFFLESFTVKLNIIWMAKLSGMVGDYEHFARFVAKKFEVHNFMDTKAKDLSGGNKRKLCTALAMIGQRPAIFLDESSAGVDPYSRRKLWKTIRDESSQSALIVTTHSMEEAEALGTKMAIMVQGQFKCFGTAQQIKRKFGQGFSAEIKVDIDQIELKSTDLRNSKIQQSDVSIRVMTEQEIRSLIETWFGHDDESNQNIMDLYDREFTQRGLLSNYFKLVKDGQKIDPGNLLKQMIIIEQITNILADLEHEFKFAILDNFVGSTMLVKIPEPGNKSIGYFYGFMEKLLSVHPIVDYAAQQTSLEQIFNSFANNHQMEKFNKSFRQRKSTLQKKND